MKTNEREKPEQIPAAQNSGETEELVNEQDSTPGERKEVNVEDYERVAALGQILKDLDFPANKDKILNL
jgi:hypothetical protein